jgi:ferredoxin
MALLDEFVAAFGIWEEARPFLDLMFDAQEMRLVVALAEQSATVPEIARRLDVPADEAAKLVQRAYRRHIVNKTLDGDALAYAAGGLYDFLDYFAKHEGWDDLPAEARDRIDRRFLGEFIDRHRDNVSRKMQGLAAEGGVPNDDILLLHEAEAMIAAATHIVVEPCDCRRLGQHCDRPVETCLWFDDAALSALERGHGRRLSRDEALALIRWTDKKGLMHTGDAAWQVHGLAYICNCCACDCYPFRAARELGSKGVWPRSRYVAVYDRAACNLCGACVKRCHFDAFFHDGATVELDGKLKKNVVFDPDLCWGCGLCANACPRDAIVMRET